MELSKLEKSTTNELISRTLKSNSEHGAAIIDSKGNVRYFTSDDHDHVEIPSDIAKMLDDTTNNITLLHSHTNNTLPSTKDFSHLLREGVGKIVVAGVNGNTYSISIGDGDRPTLEEFEQDIVEIARDIGTNMSKFPWYDGADKQVREYMFIYEKAFQIKQRYKWNMQGGNINE